jgi:hypothetical protein
MVKVELPRAQWESVLYIIEEFSKRDWPRTPNPITMALYTEIDQQVYSQEY